MLGVVDWEYGSRRGIGTSVYSPDLAQRPKCLTDLWSDQYAAQQFVKVHYRRLRSTRSVVAPAPPDLAVKSSDIVELWPADCAACVMLRITPILSTGASHEPRQPSSQK